MKNFRRKEIAGDQAGDASAFRAFPSQTMSIMIGGVSRKVYNSSIKMALSIVACNFNLESSSIGEQAEASLD
jgi:hypothetical protein